MYTAEIRGIQDHLAAPPTRPGTVREPRPKPKTRPKTRPRPCKCHSAHERSCHGLLDALDGVTDLLAEHGPDCPCGACEVASGIRFTLKGFSDLLASVCSETSVLDRWIGRLPPNHA